MKNLIACLSFLLAGPALSQEFITTDIDNFWKAYDNINVTRDSVQQYAFINEYIAKGTPGLHAMIRARNYTPEEYLKAIHSYPAFWKSVRKNTYRAKEYAEAIEQNVSKFRKLYPEAKSANVYFTIGALRSNGTTLDGMVLIGSELALGDDKTVADEMAERLGHLRYFFEANPAKEVVFLNVHEYVHTQQSATIGNTPLAQCVIEGVAEFLAAKAMDRESPTPAVQFGPKQFRRVKEAFVPDMHNPVALYNWVWNSADNEFALRDMGYYVGYAICEKYYEKASDKSVAIREMIQLDYNNPDALAAFVDKSGYFDRPVLDYKAEFDKARPKVAAIGPFTNGSTDVKPGKTTITVTFSEPLDQRYRNFELGPLGPEHLLRVGQADFSEDGRSITFTADLLPGRRYQLELGYQFRNLNGQALLPYLIDFSTAK